MGTPLPLAPRFWAKVQVGQPDECWPWLACKESSGYGRVGAGFALGGPSIWKAHRVAWTLINGPIPDGAEIDHLCHTLDLSCVQGSECPHRGCVNPNHLEPVTHRENALRRESRLTRFACGHPYSARVSNGGPSGRCGICARQKRRERYAAKRLQKERTDGAA